MAEEFELQELCNALAILAASRGEISTARLYSLYQRLLDLQAQLTQV